MQQITRTINPVELVYKRNIRIVIARDGPAVMHYLTKRSLRVEQIESQSDCSGSLFPLVNQLATLPARDLFGDTDGFPDELPDASASFPLWPEVRIFSIALPSTYQYRIKRKILPLHDLTLFFYRCVILEAEVKIYTMNNGTLLKVDHSNHDFSMLVKLMKKLFIY